MLSEVLYHFVGWGRPDNDDENFDVLCEIIESGRVGRYPNDDPASGIQLIIDLTRPLTKGELIQQSITCFCDIPFGELGLHMSKYGRFGLGIDRSWLARWGARPVAYVPKPSGDISTWGHSLAKDLQSLMQGIREHLEPEEGFETTTSRTVGARLENKQAVIDVMESILNKELLAFLKFYDSDLPENHDENYYMEREWRKFLPADLAMTLREIVMPASYAGKFKSKYPQHAIKLRLL